MGRQREGLHTRVLAWGLRKLAHAVANSGTVAIFLNQTRSRRQALGGGEESSAGGPPLKLYAGLRLALNAQTDGRVGFRILKNKAAAAFREGHLRRAPGGKFVETP